MLAFLRECKLISTKEEYPQWLIDFNDLDDEHLKILIDEEAAIIEEAKSKIDIAEEKLASNLEHKSILIETGDSLVAMVLNILQKSPSPSANHN